MAGLNLNQAKKSGGMSFSPQQVRAISDSPQGQLPRFMQRAALRTAVPTIGLPKRSGNLASQGVAQVGNQRVGTLGRLPKRSR